MPSIRAQDNSAPVGTTPREPRGVADHSVGGLASSNGPRSCPICGNFPELMTEPELIQFLRIPELSSSQSHHNVIEHLKRFRGLPRIHICNKALYPKRAIQEWVEEQTSTGD
jgi:hypothetical protein